MALTANVTVDYHLVGAGAGTACFPLYTYALDGKVRQDNVTDWALAQFQAAYGPDVTKRDIFHYVYALLHHPQYRERYKENLKRELPRVPLVGGVPALNGGATRNEPPSGLGKGDLSPEGGSSGEAGRRPGVQPRRDVGKGEGVLLFRAFADTGAQLAALHVGYEDAAEYPLNQVVNKDVPFSWRVTKMRLTPDKTAVKVNDSLTLAGVPPETFAYTLGNRSALEWVLDQYQVTTDKRSGLVSDPNRADEPDYIARLITRVVTVSRETARLVAALPPLAEA